MDFRLLVGWGFLGRPKDCRHELEFCANLRDHENWLDQFEFLEYYS